MRTARSENNSIPTSRKVSFRTDGKRGTRKKGKKREKKGKEKKVDRNGSIKRKITGTMGKEEDV